MAVAYVSPSSRHMRILLALVSAARDTNAFSELSEHAAGLTVGSVSGLPITSVNGSFPMGVWLQAPRLAQRYRDEVGINLFIGGDLSETDLEDYRKAGMPFINTQTSFSLKNALHEPLLYGYNQMDEPDNAQASPNGTGYLPCVDPKKTQALYAKWKAADPNRPVFQGLGQGCAYTNYVGRGACRNKTDMYAEYAKAADIVSFDIYPVNAEEPDVKDKLWLPAQGVSNLRQWTENTKPIWIWLETTHISRSGSGRKPTPREVKAELWLALIAGAQGYGYFCHQFFGKEVDDELLEDSEMSAAVKKINQEVASLTAALQSPNVSNFATYYTSNPAVPISFAAKETADGATYLFAAAARNGTTTVTFSLAGEQPATVAQPIGEADKGNITITDGKFEDEFSLFGVHLYRLY